MARAIIERLKWPIPRLSTRSSNRLKSIGAEVNQTRKLGYH